MKITKVLFSLVMALVFIVGVIGCTPAATPTPPPAEAPKAEAPAQKTYEYKDMVVGFLQTGSEGGWRAANSASFKETAEQLGLTLKFYDS